MNKKILIILCVVLCLIAIFNIYALQKNIFSKSTFAININWNIPFSLPISDKDIYQKQWPESGRDGNYYYIAKYDSKDKITKLNKINWNESIDDKYKELIKKFYQKLDIDDKYRIKSNKNLLYYSKDNGTDSLILVYDNKKHYLYIFEKVL